MAGTATVIKVNYEGCDEVYYEVDSSNPKHIDSIISSIESSVNLLNDIPGATDITTSIKQIKSKLLLEKKRYEGFSNAFSKFQNVVPNMDTYLRNSFSDLFHTNYANKSDQEITNFVNTYVGSSLLVSFAQIKKELGVSETDIIDLIYFFDILKLVDGLSLEEARKVLEKELSSIPKESMAYFLVSSLKDEFVGDIGSVVDTSNTVFENQINNLINTFVATSYGKTATASSLAITKGLIEKAEIQLASIESKIAQNPYILPSGKTYTKYKAASNKLAAYKSIENSLDSTRINEIENRVNGINNGIAISIIALQLSVQGYTSRVVNGKDWEDTIEDITVTGLGLGVGFLTSKTVEIAIKQFAQNSILSSSGGPISLATGFVSTLAFEAAKPKIKEFINQLTDDFHELWW